ncbi:MAG: DUF4846 domain-containing protein [Oscillospiraceae bacterium]|nr:DUF4846 domain-containing protein [Oscillospiraceae bacterium]
MRIKNSLFSRVVCPLLICAFLLSGCGWVGQPTPSPVEKPSEAPSEPPEPEDSDPEPIAIKNPEGETIETRFNPPEGYRRTDLPDDSFGAYLRALPLKQDGDVLYLHDGTIKTGGSFDAVLELKINNNRNRMRNTNFLLRLRAEYLYQAGRQDDISFHFLSGFVFDFATWAEGSRIKENENGKVVWQAASAEADDSYDALWDYLQWVYNYSNASAMKSDLLQAVRAETGCVFLSHGGAVIADMAADENGRAVILLVRGGEPEQEGYVVRNTNDAELSPWFTVPDNGIIKTPEGELSTGELYLFR